MDISAEEREERALYVASEPYDGMLPHCQIFYYHSILYSAGRCLESFNNYEIYKLKENYSPEYLVSLIQEAVGHAAALSRYFWPSTMGKKNETNLKKLRKKRGISLRKEFSLDESSPLFNRDLRNAWEHYDERLDIYFLEKQAGIFLPSCMIDSHTLADDPIGHIFKLLDIEEECLVLMGQKYFFSPIKMAVKKVYSHASRIS